MVFITIDSRYPEMMGNGINFYTMLHIVHILHMLVDDCSSVICSWFTWCINPMMWAQ